MTGFAGIVAAIAGWIVAVISTTGYLGIVLLMAIESACIPLPSEVIMPFAGYLVSTGRFDLVLTATAGAVGCNLGSAVAYAVGAWGGRSFIQRYGRFVLLSAEDLDRSERFFARFGGAAVFLGRLLPGVRSFIALPAGIAHMPLVRFHVYTFAGSWPWCFGLAYAGMILGRRWDSDPRIAGAFHYANVAIAILIAVLVIVFVVKRVLTRRSGR